MKGHSNRSRDRAAGVPDRRPRRRRRVLRDMPNLREARLTFPSHASRRLSRSIRSTPARCESNEPACATTDRCRRRASSARSSSKGLSGQQAAMRSTRLKTSRLFPGQPWRASRATASLLGGATIRPDLTEITLRASSTKAGISLTRAEAEATPSQPRETKVEIGSKTFFLDLLMERAVGRCQYASTQTNRHGSSNSLETTFLKNTKQLDLEFRRKLCNFVEKKRPLAGQFKAPRRQANAPVKAPRSWP